MEKLPTVLVIEDEAINRKILHRILESKYQVLEAENGEIGLRLCREKLEELAAVLLDLTMPVMDGFAFLAAIRGTACQSIPILVMTGSNDPETEQKALEAGAWDFVTKPYNGAILHVRLENAISRSKLALFERVKFLSEHDALTGLYNRARMFEATREMMRSLPGQEFVFVCMDFDRFSLYNSSFGEAAGNELLRYFAEMIRAQARSVGRSTFGRVAADKFCLCAPFFGHFDTVHQLLDAAQTAMNDYSKDYVLKISAGACIVQAAEAQTTDVAEFYLRATMAAEKCKSCYDSILEYYDENVRRRMDVEVQIGNEMRRALAEEQFKVYFQPKYTVAFDQPCGAEALVRWLHPTRGVVSPGSFIPVFEKNGFIAKVDHYVWEHTCAHLRRWLDAGQTPLPVSVNVSRVSLNNINIVQLLTELIGRYRIPAEMLQLEITESAYMADPAWMNELVGRLHAAGFTILMDDFGSSYSSLNTLKDIDVDILKIDMAFIPREKRVAKGEIILASMIKMACWLGLPVIVEGVETRQQRDFLEGAGCSMIQGYYYARPMPAEEYAEKYVFASHPAVPLALPAPDAPAAEKLGTVLVMDDSDIDREIISACIDSCYQVETCACAEDALVYLRRHPATVQLVLVDNLMAGMSGLEFLRFCANDDDLRAIPKVMITSNDSESDQLAAFAAGAYDFITKPLVPQIVTARLRHIMDTTYHHSSYERVKQEYALQAERNPRTGLLSHLAFRELCSRLLTTFPEDPMALLLIDLDDLDHFQAEQGQEAREQLLDRIAVELKKDFRRSDVVGQIGGDTFAVMLCGIPDKKVVKQKAADVLREIAILGAKEYGLDLSASIGLVCSIRGDTIETILAKADQALREAKSTRKGVCVVYGESVPPIRDDDRPIVLVCGGDPLTCKELALAYGEEAAFAFVKDPEDLDAAFARYGERIALLCADVNARIPVDPDGFYARVRAHGGGETIPVLALCRLGDMAQLRLAVNRSIKDLLPLPIQPDLAQAQLSRAIMRHKNAQAKREKKQPASPLQSAALEP